MIDNKDLNPLCKEAIETYGDIIQIDIAIEEMAELIKALIKYKRSNGSEESRQKVLEELSDVYIMSNQLEMIFDSKYGKIGTMNMESWMYFKLDRLKNRLSKDK